MRLLDFGALLILAAGAAGAAGAADRTSFDAVDLTAKLTPPALAERLADKRVVFVGETHNRYGDHLNQLAILQQLHGRDPDIAIGVEYLERRFQPHVDDYIAGKITEQEFLRDTQYFEGWGYDYRLYAPIFRYAREQRIPVVALNVPPSLPAAVAKVGLQGLSAEQRADLPKEIKPAGEEYRARLREAFEAHGRDRPGAFDHFVEAQLVWDEGMAESAAEYLDAHPGRRMLIFTGSGHLVFGSGIPQRLERRTAASYAIVLNGRGEELEPNMADYLLLGGEEALPPAGILGARLGEAAGQCRIDALLHGGAAEKAGLEPRDVLLTIDGQAVRSIADVHLALWDKKPGDRVRVEVRRRHRRKTRDSAVDVELMSSAAHSSSSG